MTQRHSAGKEQALAALRARIRALERGGARDGTGDGIGDGAMPEAPALALGLPALDGHLPGGGLAPAGLHEIAGARDEWDDGAAAGFCLVLLARIAAARPGRLLWAARRSDLYGPGVAAFGLDPGRLILARGARDAEVFWALEEGLRAPALAAVVGEPGEVDAIPTRRLQLAAEAAGRPCVLLRRRLFAGRGAGATGRRADRSTPGAATALSRWRVAALPPHAAGRLPGRPRWRVELLRCRGAAPRTFELEWDDAAGDFALAAGLRDRTAAARRAG